MGGGRSLLAVGLGNRLSEGKEGPKWQAESIEDDVSCRGVLGHRIQ